MIDIMKYLTTELKKINPRVYNDTADSSAIFPYVVFSLPSSTNSGNNKEDVFLEVDIWDLSKDGYDATMNVELLTSRIDKFLKTNRHIDENQLLIFTKMNQLSLRDEDSNIKRRKLRYTIKYYNRHQ